MKPFLTIADVNKQHRFKSDVVLVGDKEGLELTTYQAATEHLGEKIQGLFGKANILEICCGVGGATVFLVPYVNHIYAIDLDTERLEAAVINAKHFGVEDNITFLQGDGLDEDLLQDISKNNIDVVLTDVEWRSDLSLSLKENTPNIHETIPPTDVLYEKLARIVSQNIAMHLSKVTDRSQLRQLGRCQIEEISIAGQTRFINAYYGKLAETNDDSIIEL